MKERLKIIKRVIEKRVMRGAKKENIKAWIEHLIKNVYFNDNDFCKKLKKLLTEV